MGFDIRPQLQVPADLPSRRLGGIDYNLIRHPERANDELDCEEYFLLQRRDTHDQSLETFCIAGGLSG